MRATINAELREREETLADYRVSSSLGSQALIPLFTEIHTNDIEGENIPLMFARAYDADFAPLHHDPSSRESDCYPGLLCLLSEPLKMGIRAVAIRQRPRPDHYSPRLEWDIDKVDLLATEPATLAEQVPHAFSWASPVSALSEHPEDPNTRVHMSGVGDIITVMPSLTPNKDLQALFEKSIETRLTARPESLDECKELVPGILSIYQKDGLTLRDNMDYLVGNHFATAAHALGANPSVGKAVYTRFLREIGNRELERMSADISASKLRKRTERLYDAIEAMSARTGYDMLHDPSGKGYRYQVAVGYDDARELALAILSGRKRLAGVGPGGISVLRSMFSH